MDCLKQQEHALLSELGSGRLSDSITNPMVEAGRHSSSGKSEREGDSRLQVESSHTNANDGAGAMQRATATDGTQEAYETI